MDLNRKKYSDLVIYILSKSFNKPQFGKTVLCSLLYFIDLNYYKHYGKLLTNETYIKSKTGIQPKHFSEISNDLISKKQIILKKEPYFNRIKHRYYLIVIPNIKFNLRENKIINFSIDNLINNNATTITQYAKKDQSIKITNFGDEINFKNILSNNENK